jgi:hypothetical protein
MNYVAKVLRGRHVTIPGFWTNSGKTEFKEASDVLQVTMVANGMSDLVEISVGDLIQITAISGDTVQFQPFLKASSKMSGAESKSS